MSEDVVLSVLNINGLTWEGRIKLLAGIVDEWNRANPKPQPIPLPTVPVGTTCGGCRWWRVNENYKPTPDLGTCYSEPETAVRFEGNLACHRYQEAAK